MVTRRLLGAGRVAEVFEDGDDVIKLYQPGIGPEQAQHEALVLDALGETPLRVPVNLGVVREAGRWGLRMSRMPGTALGTKINAQNLPEILARFAQLHCSILACTARGLPLLTARLLDRIGRADLPSPLRARVLARLARLEDGDRLCHGDFHPFNIMVEGETVGLIDWVDATQGPPAADVARTYLLVALYQEAIAGLYLDAMTRGEEVTRQQAMDWLPVVAAARLAERVDGETERLLAWCELA